MNHPPTYVRPFSLHKVKKNCHFLDHPPTPMFLRNIKMAPNKIVIGQKLKLCISKCYCLINKEEFKIISEIIGLGIMKVTIWLQKYFRPIVTMPSWCSFNSDENCIQFERCKSLYKSIQNEQSSHYANIPYIIILTLIF